MNYFHLLLVISEYWLCPMNDGGRQNNPLFTAGHLRSQTVIGFNRIYFIPHVTRTTIKSLMDFMWPDQTLLLAAFECLEKST